MDREMNDFIMSDPGHAHSSPESNEALQGGSGSRSFASIVKNLSKSAETAENEDRLADSDSDLEDINVVGLRSGTH